MNIFMLSRNIGIVLGWFLFVRATFYNAAQARPKPDATFSFEERTIIDTINSSQSSLSYRIEGGAIRASTLFHSFREFNIEEGAEVYFSQPTSIEQIITRVTGDSQSNIQGRLGVLGNADLFLMNPNGIVFGRDASLDVGGSFIATTASSISLNDTLEFRADRPDELPLLNVALPTGLQFGNMPGNIVNQSIFTDGDRTLVGLNVPRRETIALVGGNISLQDGIIFAPNGNIEIGSAGANEYVSIFNIARGWEIDDSGVTNYQNITAINANVTAQRFGPRNGTIQFWGRNILLDSGSSLGGESQNGTGGDLTLTATESVRLNDSAELVSEASGQGIGGNILIETQQLIINQSLISTNSILSSTGGNIVINSGAISIDGTRSGGRFPSAINTSSRSRGEAGDIDITTGTLVLRNQGQLNSGLNTISGQPSIGGAGSINVDASLIVLDELAQITSATTGGQGDISLRTQDLILLDRSRITTRAVGQAFAGDIAIDTDTFVALDSSRVDTTARGGDGGDIRINSESLIFSPDSILDASSQFGNDGIIELNTPDTDSIEFTAELPDDAIDVAGLIDAQSCTAQGGSSSFYILGRGGLPESPLQPVWPEMIWEDWDTASVIAETEMLEGDRPTTSPHTAHTDGVQESALGEGVDRPMQSAYRAEFSSEPHPVSAQETEADRERPVEAQGWIKNANDQIVLLNHPATQTADATWLHPHDCRLLQESLVANRS